MNSKRRAAMSEIMMKCDVFLGVRHIETMERPIPAPGPKEVLIKVMACGVCGSDVHIYEGNRFHYISDKSPCSWSQPP